MKTEQQTGAEIERLIEQARGLLDSPPADLITALERAQQALEQARTLETKRRAVAKGEQERAHELHGQLSTAVEHARTFLDQSAAQFLRALEQVVELLNGAQAVAHRWNQTHAQTLLLNEEYGLSVIADGYVPLARVREAVRGIRVITGATAPVPAVRVRLNPDVAFRDYPCGAEITLPAAEAHRIEQRIGPRAFERV